MSSVELCVLEQMAVTQEVLRDVATSVPCKARGLRLIPQEPLDRRAEGREIVWVLNQETGLAVHDLVDDPADGTCHDRPRLPHRLRDREPESLGEALLRHHTRVALKRIDD